MEKQTVLFVDDDPDAEFLLRHALAREAPDLRMDWLDRGKAAIDYLQRKSPYEAKRMPRVMLLDVKMPGMDGFDVLEWLKRCPQLRPPCVIMCTTSNDLSDCNKAGELGADGFFVKPGEYPAFSEQVRVIAHCARTGVLPPGALPPRAHWFHRQFPGR